MDESQVTEITSRLDTLVSLQRIELHFVISAVLVFLALHQFNRFFGK